jgi:hypothetical protein
MMKPQLFRIVMEVPGSNLTCVTWQMYLFFAVLSGQAYCDINWKLDTVAAFQILTKYNLDISLAFEKHVQLI